MLKDCITPVFAQTRQIKELFTIEQSEVDLMEDAMKSWLSELYIMEASDTIELWEDDYSLSHNTDLTLEQRRARIIAKRMQRKIPTKETIEEALRSLLGAEQVKITEGDCMFKVRIRTAILAGNMEIAEDYFRNIRVAHFGFELINQLNRSYGMTKYFSPVTFVYKTFRMEVQR